MWRDLKGLFRLPEELAAAPVAVLTGGRSVCAKHHNFSWHFTGQPQDVGAMVKNLRPDVFFVFEDFAVGPTVVDAGLVARGIAARSDDDAYLL